MVRIFAIALGLIVLLMLSLTACTTPIRPIEADPLARQTIEVGRSKVNGCDAVPRRAIVVGSIPSVTSIISVALSVDNRQYNKIISSYLISLPTTFTDGGERTHMPISVTLIESSDLEKFKAQIKD